MNRASARSRLAKKILNLTPDSFESVALEVFQYQYQSNSFYRQFVQLLGVKPSEVEKLTEIPCLPIQFFKGQTLKSGEWTSKRIFASSGTTGAQNSQHHLRSDDWYHQNAQKGFSTFYGPLEKYCFLALLPSYLERQDSSLVFMVKDFVEHSNYPESAFFLNDLDKLVQTIRSCQARSIPVVLIGVSFALLDLAEAYSLDPAGLIVMETGGMKGRRRELTRHELHETLKASFGVDHIHSEYGMTELLSQAYSTANGVFKGAPSLRVLPREINDPLSPGPFNRTVALNLIDLANLDTLSFIASDDLGKIAEDGTFEVLGRLDNSDLRGCNLMIQ